MNGYTIQKRKTGKLLAVSLAICSACILVGRLFAMDSETTHRAVAPFTEPEVAVWPTPDPLIEMMDFPSAFDLRQTGGATVAKNQGFSSTCFPCWSFSLIGAAESAIRIATGIEYDLSEQHLLDCNTNGYGCSGGFVDGWTALRNHGAIEEECYPFLNADSPCGQDTCTPVAWISGVYPVPFSVKSIKYALFYHGALSCSMTIYDDIMSYSEGCYSNDGTKSVNHGVVILGWDDSLCNGEGAWIVKNSWGPGWGEDGCVLMKFGTCNIGKHAQWFEYSATQPGTQLHYGLSMPDTTLSAGDRFLLERYTGNPSVDPIQFLECILLDISGTYWFYPDFTMEPAWSDYNAKPGEYRSTVILNFQWPEATPAIHDIRFWGATWDIHSFELLAWDLVEWNAP